MQLDSVNYSWKVISECSTIPSNDNKHTWSGGLLTNQDSQRLEVWSLNPNIYFIFYILYIIYLYLYQFEIFIYIKSELFVFEFEFFILAYIIYPIYMEASITKWGKFSNLSIDVVWNYLSIQHFINKFDSFFNWTKKLK